MDSNSTENEPWFGGIAERRSDMDFTDDEGNDASVIWGWNSGYEEGEQEGRSRFRMIVFNFSAS